MSGCPFGSGLPHSQYFLVPFVRKILDVLVLIGLVVFHCVTTFSVSILQLRDMWCKVESQGHLINISLMTKDFEHFKYLA